MSKLETLLCSVIVGFGLAAGFQIYMAWSSLISLVWAFIRGVM